MKPRMVDFFLRYKSVSGRDTATGEIITRFYPCVPATLTVASTSSMTVEALLDSGSDSIVLPLQLARDLKLELEKASPMKVVGHMVDRFRSKVDITIGRAGHYFETLKDVEVSIPAKGIAPVIFGRKPVFEFFRITFVEAELRFTMEPYSTEVQRTAN
jgi:hypothetical protein